MKIADQINAYTGGKQTKRALSDAHLIASGVWIALEALGLMQGNASAGISLMLQCGRPEMAAEILDRVIEANRK